MLFRSIFGFAGADTSFPLFAFVFLVALGVDYNIFLMTRVREESAKIGTRPGILKGLTVTGGVITSAGIVLAATFLVLGVLRMFQTEMAYTFAGRWMSLLPYAIGLVFCLLVIALSFSRISKQPLAKPEPDTTAATTAGSNRKDR